MNITVDGFPKKGGRIHILPPSIAQKIAAGEVIERPQSVVRELIDNSIDAGAREIELSLAEGGIASIVLKDDGCGMSPEDLTQCWLKHATSKILTEDDLYSISTLGFRGEALASIAEVSQTRIETFDGSVGSSVEVEAGKLLATRPYGGKQGTRVTVSRLFFNLPGRKQFLKRPSTEYSLCKATMVEKALAHPAITFRLINDGKMALFLPARDGKKALLDRFFDVYHEAVQQKVLLHDVSTVFSSGEAQVILSNPALYQTDRRNIQIFVNKRKVQDFSFVQAIEFGYTGYLPGGRYPIASLFLTVDPAKVDVNIHPAKREVRIRDSRVIHHTIVNCVQSFLRLLTQKTIHSGRNEQVTNVNRDSLFPSGSLGSGQTKSLVSEDRIFPRMGSGVNETPSFAYRTDSPVIPVHRSSEAAKPDLTESSVQELPPVDQGPLRTPFTYLGKIFGVFFVVGFSEELWLIDMHAAHERIIFDKLRNDRTKQDLLVPLHFLIEDPDIEIRLNANLQELTSIGIELSYDKEDGMWYLESVPRAFIGEPYKLIDWIQSLPEHSEGLDRHLYATMSCRAAVKDGDEIDETHARQIIEQAIVLPEQRCPHGRPIAFRLTKAELFELVGRIV